jgi:endonuclease/exonuclease/phosphatase family metal-dependent hydrolase
MAKISPDVWVLTETSRTLQPGPGYSLVASSSDAPDRTNRGECWVAIWSRLHATPITLSADPERSGAIRLQHAIGSTLVVGTVLPWLSDRRHAPARGADAFCDVLTRQAAEWRQLQVANPGAALCVAGDFNQDLAPSHYYGSKRGRVSLDCALGETGLVCLTAGAYDPLAMVPDRASIDHICVSESLIANGRPQVLVWPEPSLVSERLTDHFGVCAELCSPMLSAQQELLSHFQS